MNKGQLAEILDLPLVFRVSNEQILLRTHKRLAEVHVLSGEFPLLSELILEYKIGTFLAGVVQTANIRASRVDIGKVLTCGTICFIAQFVGREVIKIHCTSIRVFNQNTFVELRDFFEFFDVLFCITVIFVHSLTSQL